MIKRTLILSSLLTISFFTDATPLSAQSQQRSSLSPTERQTAIDQLLTQLKTLESSQRKN